MQPGRQIPPFGWGRGAMGGGRVGQGIIRQSDANARHIVRDVWHNNVD